MSDDTAPEADQPAPTGPDLERDWATWRAAFVDDVLALEDGAALVVEAPGWAARPSRSGSRLRLFSPPRRRLAAPTVRLVRVEEHLRAHCVAAVRSGGTFPWTREEEQALLAQGWHRPSLGDGDDLVRFWPDDVPEGPFLPRATAEHAVLAVARTFREVASPQPEDAARTELPTVRPA